MLTRLRGWETLLQRYFDATERLPFVWGENDCALWSCNGIAAQTGVDPALPFKTESRLHYVSDRGAARAMRRFCGGGLDAVAEKIALDFGAPEHPGPLYAGRGDLVLFSGALGPTLGLVSLDGREVFSAGPEGRFRQPLRVLSGETGARAWRIG